MAKTEKLSHKVTNSAFWIFLFQVLDNVIGFFRLLILARLLTPKDFGLVGIAWLILQIIDNFTQTGIQQSLIHKPNSEKYLNTAWTYLLLRGIGIYAMIYILSPFLSNFFNTSGSINVIRVIGLTVLFGGFINIGTIYFQKDLSFNKQFIFQIVGNFIDFIVAIICAFIFKNVWAIVLGSLANSIATVLLSYILSSYRPKFEFKLKIFHELNNYGKWIAGSNILQFIYSQGDDLLVGKILGAIPLGFYQLAYKISNLPATQITHIISTVMFPAYSKIQNDKARISKIYLSVLQVISFLSFLIGILILCVAKDFTILFLGKKWLPMVQAMEILTMWGILRSISATTGPIWQALGKPKYVTYLQLLQVCILVSIIYPLTISFNIVGTSIAVIISLFISIIVAIYFLSKTLEISIKKIAIELLYPFFASILVFLAYKTIRLVLIPNINILSFIVLNIICILIYLIITVGLSKVLKYTIYQNLFDMISPYTKKYQNKIAFIKKITT